MDKNDKINLLRSIAGRLLHPDLMKMFSEIAEDEDLKGLDLAMYTAMRRLLEGPSKHGMVNDFTEWLAKESERFEADFSDQQKIMGNTPGEDSDLEDMGAPPTTIDVPDISPEGQDVMATFLGFLSGDPEIVDEHTPEEDDEDIRSMDSSTLDLLKDLASSERSGSSVYEEDDEEDDDDDDDFDVFIMSV